MQGVVFMPQNLHQGSPPPTSDLASDMDHTSAKDADRSHRSDSGIFSTTTNTTIDQSDARSDCSSPERKYVCSMCDRMLTSQHEFTLHIRSHNNEDEKEGRGFVCRICNKVLSSSSSRDRHVLVHSGERPFNCKYCGDTFTTNGNMHRHMRTHSNKSESYESDASTDSGSSKSTECNNNKVENKKRKHEDVDDSNKRLETDKPSDQRQSFKCPVCERADFDSISNLEAHVEDNHPKYPAKCNMCKQIFLNNESLTVHKENVHESSLSTPPVIGFKNLTFVDFSSEKFPYIAKRECEMNLHKAASGLKFQCRKCIRAFPSSNSLEIHEQSCVASSQLVNGLDLSKSNISEKEIRRTEFFSRLNLQDNSPEKKTQVITPTHTPTKLREQLEGTKDLADIQSILSNINLQQLQKQKQPLVLDTPVDSARNEEEESQDVFAVEFRKMKLRGEFPCRLCTAVFPNLRALKGHNRAHLNGNNNGTYYCNMCPHSSIDKAALIRHMRTHNGDRPYECSLCNYAFTTKANCERHLRNRHAKTTREEVKKSIIYHPSEDPTNEDLNKLAQKDDIKKFDSPEKLHCSTPKINVPDVNLLKPTVPPLIPELQVLKQSKMFTGIIRNENLRHLKEQKLIPNGAPLLYNAFAPKVPEPPPQKIHVRSLESLKENNSYSEDEYAEEDEQPLDLVLDLSKKKQDEEVKTVAREEEAPQDLSKKSPAPQFASSVNPMFKFHPEISPTALYATHLANLYRSGFPGLPNWTGFPALNPLLFSTLPAPGIPPNPDLKERMQRLQLCGGSMIAENYKNLQNVHLDPIPPPFKAEINYPSPKKPEEISKPLSLNVDIGYSENATKLHSPKSDIMQSSPNSVKMVIKNGVLMPKQKQRRYRTERPFTCEFCSARFTLRSNMERHVKQQHPQHWSQRQRGGVGTPGRKPQNLPLKPTYCEQLNIPKITQDYEETKDQINERLRFAILTQQLKAPQHPTKKEEEEEDEDEEDEDCELVIDEKPETKTEEIQRGEAEQRTQILEDKLREIKQEKSKQEEDLVPVSRLLDNASQQPFKEYFKREEENEAEGVSEEEEGWLMASSSNSDGNISGTDENRSESEATPSAPAKKKSAYSLAPNRVSCQFCSRKFPWTSSLRRHILTHTGQKPFKCSHCPLLFTTKSNCDRHLLRKHGNAATTIANGEAAAAGGPNNPNYLMRNVPERPFKCPSCPSSTFSTHSNLKKHISCKHSNTEESKAQGYEAGSSEDEKINQETSKTDWESQIAFNKLPTNGEQTAGGGGDLPFKCHLCEGSFGERQEALDHIRDKHASEYDLLMSKNALEANAGAPDDANNAHHDDEEGGGGGDARGKFPDYSNRKVVCAFCVRRFWSAEDLRRHMRTHTGERPFSCDICRRRFTLKHSMLRHRKKHNAGYADATANSDEDNAGAVKEKSTEESDGNEGGDLISNLLGIRDRGFIDKVLNANADDAAKLLGVRNGNGARE